MRAAPFIALLILFSCREKKEEAPKPLPFNTAQWSETKGRDHPWRTAMLPDLLEHVKLHGLHRDSVLNLLGPPEREENGHLFYRLSEKRMGDVVLHARTLVIKFRPDSTVEWRKIHQ